MQIFPKGIFRNLPPSDTIVITAIALLIAK